MEDKTYGIKTHLVEEFKQLQISRRKIAMAFLGNCTLIINATPIRTRIEAANGIISLLPFPLFPAGLVGFRIPPQRPSLIFPNFVSIMFHPALKIDLLFDTEEQKMEFIRALNLPEDGSSSEGSASLSSPPSNPSSGPSDSGVENAE